MFSDRTADFELIIGDAPAPGATKAATRHPVQVTSPAGSGFEVIDLDLAADEPKNTLSAATGEVPDFDRRKKAGEALFERLFRGEVGACWYGSLGKLDGGILRVRLWFRDPALAALPWELLYDQSRFLAADRRLTISRYLPGPEPLYIDPVPKLRVLLVICRPKEGQGFDPIPDKAIDDLKALLDKYPKHLEYEPLVNNPTLDQVRKKLDEGFHVLHYLGHGEEGRLIFVKPDGSPDPLPVENLRQVTVGLRTLRAVVLNACASAQAGTADVFAGVGPGLVQVGVPAAVAMQYQSTELGTASAFNDAFYHSLTDNCPIDVAVTKARLAVSAKDVADRGWSTPILYVGTRGGRVIELAAGAAENDPWTRLKQVADEVAGAREAVAELTGQFRQLSDRLGKLELLTGIGERARQVLTQAAPLFKHASTGDGSLSDPGWNAVNEVWPKVEAESLRDLGAAVAGGPPALRALWPAVEATSAELQTAYEGQLLARIPKALAKLQAKLGGLNRAADEAVAVALRDAATSAQVVLGRFGPPNVV